MLVVDARDSGRGRLLVVEPDVSDRCLTGVGPMLSQVALTSDSGILPMMSVGGLTCLWKWLGVEVVGGTCALGNKG